MIISERALLLMDYLVQWDISKHYCHSSESRAKSLQAYIHEFTDKNEKIHFPVNAPFGENSREWFKEILDELNILKKRT